MNLRLMPLLCLLAVLSPHVWAGAFAERVVSVTFGSPRDASFGDVSKALGPPRAYDTLGLGGSEDVVNIGIGGEIMLEFVNQVIYDGPGSDFTVFENPFFIGGDFSRVFLEPGIVFVSSDGDRYTSFPIDYTPPDPPTAGGDDNPDNYKGFAGIRPVFANPDFGISAFDPGVSGGDQFDLADIRERAKLQGVDVNNIRFIRIRDIRRGIDRDDDGDIIPGTTYPLANGFDLDAIAGIHTRPVEDILGCSGRWAFYE